MKKTTFMIVMLCLVHIAYAQKSIEFGAKVIPQTSWLYNSDDDEAQEYKFRTTWRTGYALEVGFNFDENFGIRTGIVYSPQGQKHKGDWVDSSISSPYYPADIELSYWKIPVLLKFSSDPTLSAYMVFFMGPEFAFLTKARHTYESSTAQTSFENNLAASGFTSPRDIYNKTFVSFALGFGPNFSITDHLKINCVFRFSIATKDAENKDLKTDTGQKYWDLFGLGGDKRETMLNFTGGLNIGITYLLEL